VIGILFVALETSMQWKEGDNGAENGRGVSKLTKVFSSTKHSMKKKKKMPDSHFVIQG